MVHPICRVTSVEKLAQYTLRLRFVGLTSVEKLAQYTLRLRFDDDTEQVIDFEPVLAGELYRPLRDPSFFDKVRIDPEVHTIVWPNGADFDPATLYDWPKYAPELTVRARKWDTTTASA